MGLIGDIRIRRNQSLIDDAFGHFRRAHADAVFVSYQPQKKKLTFSPSSFSQKHILKIVDFFLNKF